MNPGEYCERVSARKDEVVATLRKKGVKDAHLAFGGPGAEPKRKLSNISGERSDFSVHRPVGDWAEQITIEALSNAFPEWQVARYGDTYSGRAGSAEFNELRKRQMLETRLYGKRPDLLIFPEDVAVGDDLCAQPCEATEATVKQAIGAVEIRSSKLDALKYIATRKTQRDSGKKVSRDAPSFTVKVEDLVIVYRWIERYEVPQSYCQVFLDSVFAINFLALRYLYLL
jgi:hypothetical protein